MRILIVANYAKEHINKFHKKTIKAMKANGYQVDVACNMDEEVCECDVSFDIGCTRNPFSFKSLKSIQKLKKIIINGEYDFIHCHTLSGRFIGTIALVLSRKVKTKLIFTYHGLNFFKGSSIVSKIFIPFERLLSKRIVFGFCVNTEDAVFLKDKCKKDITICYPYLDFDKFSKNEIAKFDKETYRKKLGLEDSDLVLTYVAEINDNKNQKFLVQVLKRLLIKNSNYKLLLVGPDHSNGSFQKYLIKRKLSDRVNLLGWRDDVPQILYSSDIYIASSIREGFGINIIEAQYCKLPVVATNNRGHREIIDDGQTGFLISDFNVSLFAQKVELLSNDLDVRQELIEKAFQKILFFGENNMEKRIIEKYSGYQNE